MSIQAMSWALEQQIVVDPAARHVLLVLANYAGEAGRAAFPSTARLARETGLSERTVKRKLGCLRAAGVIKLGNQAIAAAHISRVDRRPTCYDLCLARGVTVTPRAEDAGCQWRHDGVTLATSRGVTVTPEPPPEPLVLRPLLPLQHREAEISGSGGEIIWDPILQDRQATILQVAQGLPPARVQDLADELAGAMHAAKEGRRQPVANAHAWLSRLRDSWGVGPARLEHALELRHRRLGSITTNTASAAPAAPRAVAIAALAEAKAAAAAGVKKSRRRD